MNIKDTITKANNSATNRIAFVILTVFCSFLFIILINAVVLFSTDNWNEENMKYAETWLSLFKDGFLLLGGALTTLIGYYFGTKGSEAALENAQKYVKQAEELEAEFKNAAPTYNEDELDIQSF